MFGKAGMKAYDNNKHTRLVIVYLFTLAITRIAVAAVD